MRILSSLLKELEARGFAIEHDRQRQRDVWVKLGRDEDRFQLSERIRQYRRELTPVGRSCVAIAERIVSEVATLRQAASGDSAFSGTIRLGVSEVVALSWLRRLLSRIEDGYPSWT